MPSTKARCPKCERCFRRLDTHLRVSATCRDVRGTLAAPPPKSMNNISSTANSNSTASHSNLSTMLRGNLNSTVTASAVSTTTSTATLDTPLCSSTSPILHFKYPLRLPRSPEEWEEADFLLSSISTSGLQASSAEEKNSCLCAGVYNILSGRFGSRAPSQPQRVLQPKLRQHDRALKQVTWLKNEARRAFRRAKREGMNDHTIQSLAANFLSLLRQHSRLKRASSRRLQDREAKLVRDKYHQNFWKFAKNLLDGDSTLTSPEFSASSAHSFFSEVYNSAPHNFQSPSWMPSIPLPQPDCSMDMSPVSEEELARAIKKCRSSSAPSPFDRIPYTIFKKCPSLRPALLDLFNRVIMEGNVPSSWKMAAVKLIPKSSAKEDPSSPGNFRPIALTPAVSKLLSGILKDRWLRHMRANNYLNPDLQKAFLPTVPGVAEHQAKLAAVIRSARQHKHSLAIAWLDIVNAYGSVHHSLI